MNKKIKKIHRHIVTPEVQKAIEATASLLPAMTKIDPNTGSGIYETKMHVVLGSQIPPKRRKEINNWDPNKRYPVKEILPVYVKHHLVMRDIYEHDGGKGIEDYLNIIQTHLTHEQLLLKNLKEESLWQKFVRFVKG